MKLYPHKVAGTYHVNPYYSDMFVDVAEYFAYLKKVRIDELELVAQSLGAKYFKIELKTHEKSTYKNSKSRSVGVMKHKGESSSQNSKYGYADISVAAESYFKGSAEPVKPRLVYFKNDSNIKALIDMKTDKNRQNLLKSKTYSIQYGETTGIKAEQVTDMRLALKNINCGFADSFVQTAEKESRTILEYSISF